MRTMRAVIGLLAPALLAAACDAPGGRKRSHPPGASRELTRPGTSRLVVRERIPAFLAPNGDSLLVTPASAAAIAGRRVAALLSYDDRLVVHDLDADSAVLLGGKGSGPGELTGGMWFVALSPAGFAAAASLIDGRVHVWRPTGALHFSRTVTPPLDAYPTIAVDDSGRAYVAVESHASGRRRVQLVRVGRDSEDSAASAWLDVPEPVVRLGKRGSIRRTLPDNAFVYGDNPGKLWWAVSGSGLLYIANADRYQVDTMRLGGGRGTFITRPDIEAREASDAERERILAGYRRPDWADAPMTARDLGRVRHAVVHGLVLAGDEIWVARGRAADTGAARRYDLYGARDGRPRGSVEAERALIGVGVDAALSASLNEDGERSLVVLRWDTGGRAALDSAAWRVHTPRATPALAARAGSAGVAAARAAGLDTAGHFPGLGCAIIPGHSASDWTLVRVRIEAGPPNHRRRVLVRAGNASAGASRPSVTLSLVGADASTTCSGRAVEFVLKGVLRLDLRVTATSSGPFAFTLYDANDSRRSVTRVVRPGDGEAAVVLPPR